MVALSNAHVVVVTGGASGNGRAIALEFAREGVDVVIADLQETPREGGTPTHEYITEETDAEATFVQCDVASIDDLQATMDAAESLGGVDVMVNNAGILYLKDFLDVSETEYNQLMDVNVKGVFFGTQIAASRMIEHGRDGTVINISSVAGFRGAPNMVAYSASKGAVRVMTYALAGTLGPRGVRVNAVHPGPIETSMSTEDAPLLGSDSPDEYAKINPLGRAGRPDDVANATLFLASDLAEFVNGESLIVDGGMYHTKQTSV